VERLRAKGRQTNIDLSERDKDIDKQERREIIKESRWRDLEDGNEERGNKCWMEGEERRSRMCLRRERQLRHVEWM
jgi:hypothetical protein